MWAWPGVFHFGARRSATRRTTHSPSTRTRAMRTRRERMTSEPSSAVKRQVTSTRSVPPLRRSIPQVNGRGVTLTIRLSNLVDGSITRQVVGAWVLVADGTLRGYQKLESDRPLLEAASRVTDMRLRTVNVMPNDIIILAVQEARSNDGIWRRDQAELQEEVRRTLLP